LKSDSREAPVSYPSYLMLDELIELQHPRSSPEHEDELLFIVVHQSSELWFKAILHDLDGLVEALEKKSAAAALWRVQRVNAMMRIVSAQLSALDALPPQHFAEFRGYLGTSSGSQSVQFRAIEAASGRREPHFLQVIKEHGPVPELVQKWLDRPTLQDQFLALLSAEGISLDDLYLGPGPSITFFLAEALLEYEQQFAEWRFKHVQLVERIIGPATEGTGGTLGARYLRKTVDQKFFPALWQVRARFFGAKP
jgi:tryptophan 2,3-dioxygenase